MRLEILNEELGICTIDGLEDLGAIQEKRIKEQMPEGTRLEDLAFFYMPDRDWIVINRSHELSDCNANIIEMYMEMSPKGRKQCSACGKVKDTLRILDDIISRRRPIYGKALPFLIDGRQGVANGKDTCIL